MIAEGGCLCGAVRYRFDAEPTNIGYCHCSMCRKASGSPVIAACTLPRDRLQMLQGEDALVRYPSSPAVTRLFCGTCGGHLFFDIPDEPDTIDIWLGSLDEPDRVVPTFHIYAADAVAWHRIDDGLPRYPAGRAK
ncbi:GFA family protein [Sphingoaurantiacus capsulatus]|uniref:GFA family protein n=1 Tax=Sphingoaurantiacus capsulatus TaxID=1771310 RepID=A0ABV7X9N7_9SPHN